MKGGSDFRMNVPGRMYLGYVDEEYDKDVYADDKG